MKKLFLLFIGLLFWAGSSWGQNLSEGFENAVLVPPLGWTVYYANPSPPAGNHVTHSLDHAYAGSRSFRFSSYVLGAPYDQYLITPELNVTSGDQTISFYYRSYNNITEIFRVGWSSTGNAITDFTWSDDIDDAPYIDWKQYVNNDLPVGTKYVAIHYKSISKFRLYIDQVEGPTLHVDPTISTFPYVQSFEGDEFPPLGWININTAGIGGEGSWDRETSGTFPTCTPHSGSAMIRYNSLSLAVGTKGELITPPVNFPDDDYRVSFWMYRDVSYPMNFDLVNVYYNTTNSTTGGTLLGTINRQTSLAPVEASNGWYQYYFNLPVGAAGNKRYIIFEAVSGNGFNMFLDDIAIEEIPCQAPTALTVSDLTTSSASLGWTETGGATAWDIKWDVSDFNPYSEGTLISGVGTNSYTLSGLTENSTYVWYVKSICGEGYHSMWTGPSTFNTFCNAKDLPFTEDFESMDTDFICWNVMGNTAAQGGLNGNNLVSKSDLTWFVCTQYSFSGEGETYIHSGERSAALGFRSADFNWLISSDINMPATGNVDLKFWLWYRSDELGLAKFYVNVFADGEWNTILTYNTESQTTAFDSEIVASLDAYIGKTIKVAFVYEYNGGWELAIDDISIDVTTCPAPETLTVSNLTTNSANLGWTERGDATSWNIKWGLSGFNPDTEGTTISGVSANPYTLSALTAGATYDWYVLTDCGNGNVSNWVGPSTFTILCNAIDLPYTEGFESMNTVFNCWSVMGNTEAQGGLNGDGLVPKSGKTWFVCTPDSFGELYIHSGVRSAALGFNVTDFNWLVSSDINMPANGSVDLKFWLWYNSTDRVTKFYVNVFADNNWSTILTYNTVDQVNMYDSEIVVSLDAYIGKTIKVAFVYEFNEGWQLALDDISIYVPTCPAPEALTVSELTTNSANLGWTERGDATTWNIKWGEAGFNPATHGTLISGVSANPYTLSDLTENIIYDWYVQAVCGGEQSDWAGPSTFTILCNAIDLPFTEGFESMTTDFNCWTVMGNTAAQGGLNGGYLVPKFGKTWFVCKPASFGGYGDMFIHSGERSAALGFGAIDFNWLVSSDIIMPEAGYVELKFWLWYNCTDVVTKFYVNVFTEGNWSTILTYNTDYQANLYNSEIVASLDAYIGKTIKIAFVYEAYPGWQLALDDISIYVPTCPAPEALTVSELTTNSANLGWTERGSATSWNIKWGEVGFNPADDGTTISGVSANSYTLSDLTENTAYDWYVQAVCGDEQSNWAGPETFMTRCGPVSIPYFESFDGVTAPALPNCMSMIDANIDDITWETEAVGMSSPNAAVIFYNAKEAMNDWLFTAGLQLEANTTYELGFAYGAGSAYSEKLAVYWGSAPQVVNMMEGPIFDHSFDDGSWHMATATITPTSAGVYYIGFHGYSDKNKIAISLDDIYVIEQVANTTWSGTVDNNWQNAGNWLDGALPGSSTDVVIPAGLTNYPTITNGANCNTITLKSNASGTASLLGNALLTVSGDATVERYISGAAEAWHLLSSPVEMQSISGDFTPEGTYGDQTGYDFYAWNEPSETWLNQKVSSNDLNEFTPGQGYLVAYQAANPTKVFKGKLNKWNYYTPLTISGTSSYKWSNLLGNPYPSSIDWKSPGPSGLDKSSLVVESGGGSNMYIYNQAFNNYGVYNDANSGDGGTNGATRYIAPMQGFFVIAAEAGNFYFKEEARVHSPQSWLKSGNDNAFRLSVTAPANEGKDEILLDFGHEASLGGADKWYSMSNTAPSIYVPTAERDYSIRFLTSIADNPIVPVAFKAGVDGDYSIQANFNTASFSSVKLMDKLTGNVQDLNTNPFYAFTATTGDDANRFDIVFATLDIDKPATTNGIQVYAYGDVLYVATTSTESALVNVYNLTGQLVMQAKTGGDTLSTFNASALSNGVYVVSVISNQGVVSQKVVVRK